MDPEKVILFGSHAMLGWVEHRYPEGGITYEYISDYDILVITKSGESRKDYEVQDLLENRCFYRTPVTVITHEIDFVNKMLSEGQYFFTDIEKEGILLYDAGNTPLAERKPFSLAEAHSSVPFQLHNKRRSQTVAKNKWQRIEGPQQFQRAFA